MLLCSKPCDSFEISKWERRKRRTVNTVDVGQLRSAVCKPEVEGRSISVQLICADGAERDGDAGHGLRKTRFLAGVLERSGHPGTIGALVASAP